MRKGGMLAVKEAREGAFEAQSGGKELRFFVAKYSGGKEIKRTGEHIVLDDLGGERRNLNRKYIA